MRSGRRESETCFSHQSRAAFGVFEMAELDPKTIYGKIAFIHRQCLAFSGDRELRLLQGMTLPKMYIAVDRQAHNVNWSSRRDRRNVVLNAIASADLESGYVFGFHLNFDPSMDPLQVEREANAAGDLGSMSPSGSMRESGLRATTLPRWQTAPGFGPKDLMAAAG